MINRKNHGEYGAILACSILEKLKMPLKNRILVMSAIGNHDESTGEAIDAISAALILADKTDVRRNRVRNKEKASFDKHDRVNYAVTSAAVKVNAQKHLIALNLQIDEEICTMYEYFEIFLGRMMMCRKQQKYWEPGLNLPQTEAKYYRHGGKIEKAVGQFARTEAEIKEFAK